MPAGLELGQLAPRRGDARRARLVGESDHAVGVADVERSPSSAMPKGWFSPSRNTSRISATPSPSASRSSVMRFGLSPTAAARFIVLNMA